MGLNVNEYLMSRIFHGLFYLFDYAGRECELRLIILIIYIKIMSPLCEAEHTQHIHTNILSTLQHFTRLLTEPSENVLQCIWF